MNYYQRVIEARRRQALFWPSIQTRPVDPVQVNPQEPPKPDEIPKPSEGGLAPKADMKNIADRVLSEGFQIPQQESGTPKNLQQPGLQASPQSSGNMGAFQSQLLQRRKLKEPSPIGGII